MAECPKSAGRLLFAGDPHGYFGQVREAVAQQAPGALVMLGDYDLVRPLQDELSEVLDACEVFWIPGNHDTDRQRWYDNLFGSSLAPANLHGRVVKVGGLRIAGLGGVFRGRLWFPGEKMKYRSREEWLSRNPRSAWWRGSIPRQHRSSIWFEDYESLWDQQADILVSHEAPTSHRYGFEEIDDLAEAMGAELIVHGHHHVDYVARAENGIRALGVGLGSVATREGHVVARRARRSGAS